MLEMKTMGIVRRIDNLGRVVIPREIRRALRLREGDPVEILANRNGEVTLRKYSPIVESIDFASEYTESLFQTLGHVALICDRDVIISASGTYDNYAGQAISAKLEKIIGEGKNLIAHRDGIPQPIPVLLAEEDEYESQLIIPIFLEEDAVGAVILVSHDPEKPMGEAESKTVQTVCGFISKQMDGILARRYYGY